MKIKELNKFHIEVLTQALTYRASHLSSETSGLDFLIQNALKAKEYNKVSECSSKLHNISVEIKNIERYLKEINSDLYIGQELTSISWDYYIPNYNDLAEIMGVWATKLADTASSWNRDYIIEKSQLLLAVAQLTYFFSSK